MVHRGKKLTEEERRGTERASERARGRQRQSATQKKRTRTNDDANFRRQLTYSRGALKAELAVEGNRGGIDEADLAERTAGEAREGLAGKQGLLGSGRQMRPAKEGTTKGRCVGCVAQRE